VTARLQAPPPVNAAVLVGQIMVHPHEGIEVRTRWGEMAWQLGGAGPKIVLSLGSLLVDLVEVAIGVGRGEQDGGRRAA
jgi:hypothetical protein